jgi:hypothetical protein
LVVDCDSPRPTLDDNAKIDCVPSQSDTFDQKECPKELYNDTFRDSQSYLKSTHERDMQRDINTKGAHCVICVITFGETDSASQLLNNDALQASPKSANIDHEITNTCQDKDIDQKIMHTKQLNMGIATGNISMGVNDIRLEDRIKETIAISSVSSREKCLLEKIHATRCQTVGTLMVEEKIRRS